MIITDGRRESRWASSQSARSHPWLANCAARLGTPAWKILLISFFFNKDSNMKLTCKRNGLWCCVNADNNFSVCWKCTLSSNFPWATNNRSRLRRWQTNVDDQYRFIGSSHLLNPKRQTWPKYASTFNFYSLFDFISSFISKKTFYFEAAFCLPFWILLKNQEEIKACKSVKDKPTIDWPLKENTMNCAIHPSSSLVHFCAKFKLKISKR